MTGTTASPQRRKLSLRNKNIQNVPTSGLKKCLGGSKKSARESKIERNKEKVYVVLEEEKHECTPTEKTRKTEKSSSYWKLLAEERRVKLEKALEENKDLSELLKTRGEEVNDLEEERANLLKENQILREKAQKINELEELIAELVSANDEESNDHEE